jgi:TRAP transporter TAXI family solute receptor
MKRSGRIIGLTVLALLFITMPLTGLSAAEQKMVKIRIGGGHPGGGLLMRMSGVAEAINRGAPDVEAAAISGGTLANIKRMRTGQVDFAELALPVAKVAARGLDPWKQPTEICFVMAMLRHLAGPVVTAKTGLTSMEELVAKRYPLRMSASRRGAFPTIVASLILGSYGVSFKDIESWGGKVFYVSGKTGATQVRDGYQDAVWISGGVPTVEIMELGRSVDLTFLAIDPKDPKVLEAFKERGLRRTTIPAGIYDFVKKDTPGLWWPGIFICRADLPEGVVYSVTKALWEQRSYMWDVHRQYKKNLKDPKYITSGATEDVPMHPGARKYYKEMGWLK